MNSWLIPADEVERHCAELKLDPARVDPRTVQLHFADGRSASALTPPSDSDAEVWQISFFHPDLFDGEGGTVELIYTPQRNSQS